MTVRFLNGGFSDTSGAMVMGEDETFVVFTPGTDPVTGKPKKPGPAATIANPSNGGTITAAQINAQRYIDITYTSLPPATGVAPEPINKSSIENAGSAPFFISGTFGDLATTGSGSTIRPVIVGAPLLISGRADTATTVTYRYFLKDSHAVEHHRSVPARPGDAHLRGRPDHQRHRRRAASRATGCRPRPSPSTPPRPARPRPAARSPSAR